MQPWFVKNIVPKDDLIVRKHMTLTYIHKTLRKQSLSPWMISSIISVIIIIHLIINGVHLSDIVTEVLVV